MKSINLSNSQQSGAETGVRCPVGMGSGRSWQLAGGSAITVRPAEHGVLRIQAGRVWATLDGPHSGPANDWGDLILNQGQSIDLRRGQRLVVEPAVNPARGLNQSVCVEWEPSSQQRPV